VSDTKLLTGLSLTLGQSNTFAANTTLLDTLFDRTGNATFRVWANFPSTIANGCLFELGGTTYGCHIGINQSTTTPTFFWRAGGGGTIGTNTAYISTTDFPADDKDHEIIFDVDAVNYTVRLWIDGKFVGSDTAADQFETGVWAGTDDGAVGRIESAGQTGASNDPWPGGLPSSMEYFHDQLANTSYSGITYDVTFSPRDLFVNGTWTGGWYDPNDLDAMRVAGVYASGMLSDTEKVNVKPTAAGDLIGFIADKSQIGSDLDSYFEFSDNLLGEAAQDYPTGHGGVPATITENANGTFTVDSANGYQSVSQGFTCVVGEWYMVQHDLISSTNWHTIISTSATNWSINRYDIAWNVIDTGAMPFTSHFFQATATTHYIHLVDNSAVVGGSVISKPKIVEIPGNHIWTDVKAERPTLRQDATSGRYYIEFDGSTANTHFLASPGLVNASSNATVVTQATLNDGQTYPYLLGQNPYDDGLGLIGDSTNENPRFFAITSSGAIANTSPNGAWSSTYPEIMTLEWIRTTGDLSLRRQGRLDKSQSGTAANLIVPTNYVIGSAGTGRGPWDGNWYGMTLINRELTDSEILDLERYYGDVHHFNAGEPAIIADYTSVSLDASAYGFPGNPGANLTTSSIATTSGAIADDATDLWDQATTNTSVAGTEYEYIAANGSYVVARNATSGGVITLYNNFDRSKHYLIRLWISEGNTDPYYTSKGVELRETGGAHLQFWNNGTYAGGTFNVGGQTSTPTLYEAYFYSNTPGSNYTINIQEPNSTWSGAVAPNIEVYEVPPGMYNIQSAIFDDSLKSNTEVDTPTLTQEHALTVTEITSNSEVDTPTLTQNYQLTVTEITSNSEVDSATLTQEHALTATEITANSEVDTPTINNKWVLTATEITSNSEVDTPTITQVHNLTATEINSLSEVDTTNITQNHQLAVTEITSNSEVDSTTITQSHTLTVTEITSNSEVDSATLTQEHALTATEITANSEVDTPTAYLATPTHWVGLINVSSTAVKTAGGTATSASEPFVMSVEFLQGGATYNLTATEITSNSEVDSATLTQNHQLTVTEITSNSEVDTPTITQTHVLTATEIESASEVDTTNITQNHQLAVTEITSNSEVDTPTLTQEHALTVTEITSNSEVDTPTLTQSHTLTVTEITSNTEVDTPTGGYVFTATEITSNSEVDTPTITQVHNLTATEIESASEVDQTNITQNHQLAVTEITSNSEVDTPTLTQNHQLAVTEITSNSEVDTPTLTQSHTLTVTEITSNSEVDTPTLTQNHQLAVTEITSNSEVDSPVLTVGFILTATEITSNSEVDSATLTQNHQLTATEINSASEVDQTNITQNHQLAVTEITSNSEVDTPTITQTHNVTASEISSNTEVDTPTLTQEHPLTVTEITSNSEVDSSTLTQVHNFTATEIESASEVDTTNITQNHIFVATEITANSEVDSPAASHIHVLTATEITSNSEVDTPTLTQNHQLTATEIESATELDNPVLAEGVNHPLTATEITANSEVDSPAITQEHALTATEINSASEVDQTNITQTHDLGNVVEITANSEVDIPLLTNKWILTATEIESASEVDTTNISQDHVLTVAEITSNSEVDTPTINNKWVLTTTEITSNSEVDTPAITQNHQLTATEINSTSEVDTTNITQSEVLTSQPVTSNSEVDNPPLGQIHNLTATEIESSSEVDTINLGDKWVLTATEITANTEVDTPTITQIHALTATEIESASEVETTDLIETGFIVPDPLTSNSEVDTPTLGHIYYLNATEISSNTEVDTPTSGQVHYLNAIDSSANSEVDTPTLGRKYVLAANNIQSKTYYQFQLDREPLNNWNWPRTRNDSIELTENKAITQSIIAKTSDSYSVEIEENQATRGNKSVTPKMKSTSSIEIDSELDVKYYVLNAQSIGSQAA
jgi:hypothetical protein